MGVSEQAGGRGSVFILGQFVEGGVAPAFSAQLGQGDPNGDLVNPGCEEAAAFKGAKLIQHAQKGLLRHFFNERLEERVVRGKPARQGIRQSLLDDLAQVI